MVYRRRYPKRRRYAKKRTMKKRKSKSTVSGNRTIVRVPKLTLGFPDVYQCHLKYVMDGDLNLTAATYAAQHVFRLNSLFDPDFTGVGAQPTYFDQLMTIYDRYTVDYVTASFVFINVNTSQPVMMNLYPSTQNTNSETVLVNTMDAKSSPLLVFSSEGSQNLLRYTKTYNIANIFGVTPTTVLNNASYSGTDATNPNNTAWLYVNGQTFDAYDATIRFTCQLTFHAQFDQILNVAGS